MYFLLGISNQRPSSSIEFKNDGKKKRNYKFNTNNICDACQNKEIKGKNKLEAREQQFKKLCNKYRKNDGNYDCLVRSGGKDSFMTAHLLKYKYGMNPLHALGRLIFIQIGDGKIIKSWIHSGF